VPAKFVNETIKAMFKAFRVEPFYKPEIIETTFTLKKLIPDYIDCILVATAAFKRRPSNTRFKNPSP